MLMQLVTDSDKSPSAAGASVVNTSAVLQSPSYPEYRTMRRNGAVAGVFKTRVIEYQTGGALS